MKIPASGREREGGEDGGKMGQLCNPNTKKSQNTKNNVWSKRGAQPTQKQHPSSYGKEERGFSLLDSRRLKQRRPLDSTVRSDLIYRFRVLGTKINRGLGRTVMSLGCETRRRMDGWCGRGADGRVGRERGLWVGSGGENPGGIPPLGTCGGLRGASL